MKKLFLLLAFPSFMMTYSQVGINTPSPDTSLDVRAKNHLGAVTSTDGVLVPRVNSLATAGSNNGQLVYLIADNGGYTKGFHYWNGTAWTPLGAKTGTVIGYDALVSGKTVNHPGVDNTYNTVLDLSIGSGDLALWRTSPTTLTVPAGKAGKYLVSYTVGLSVVGNVTNAYSFYALLYINGAGPSTFPGASIPAANGYNSAIFALSWSEIVDLQVGQTIQIKTGTYGPGTGTAKTYKLARLSLEKID